MIAVIIALVSFFAPRAPRAHAAGAARPPVLDVDLPDPDIVTDGTAWYLFGTNSTIAGQNRNIPVASGPNLNALGTIRDALPVLGAWASPGFTWAPGVAHVGSTWVLWYTAMQTSSQRQCIGRATATSPLGPYHDSSSAPVICQLDRGGSIDPSPYEAPDGTLWLDWKSDDSVVGGAPVLWSVRLTADGLTPTGQAAALLQADAAWEGGVIEGPAMINAGGTTWLFYAGGFWASDAYAEGYARCTGPAGPCTKVTTAGPWMSTGNTGLTGPGGASLVSFGSYAVMALHSWRGAVGTGGWRAPSVEPVSFSPAPDWQPGWYQGVPGGRLTQTGDGPVSIDRYGEVHAPDGVAARDEAVWPGWQIAQALAVSPAGGGVTLDGWGGLHPFRFDSAADPRVGAGAAWWQGWDIARDLAVVSWTPAASGYVLEGWGGLHTFGNAPPVTNGPYWYGWDIARRVVLLPSGDSGYVLDGWGGIHPFSIDGVATPPPALGATYWYGWDIARDIVLDPDGSGGFLLDGWGGLHPFATGGAAPQAVPSSYYAPAGPAAVDLVVNSWSPPSGYVLDAAGSRHPFG